MSLIKKDAFFFHTLVVVVLLISIFLTVSYFRSGSFDLFPEGSSGYKDTLCYSTGGLCTSENACSNRGGYNWYSRGCKNDSICCYIPKSRLEYSGDKISVKADCTIRKTINVFISGVDLDENPDGYWVYLVLPNGQRAYLDWSLVGASGTIYDTVYSIRGSVSETLQPNTQYMAVIARGAFTNSVPTLSAPWYDLDFTTPTCK